MLAWCGELVSPVIQASSVILTQFACSSNPQCGVSCFHGRAVLGTSDQWWNAWRGRVQGSGCLCWAPSCWPHSCSCPGLGQCHWRDRPHYVTSKAPALPEGLMEKPPVSTGCLWAHHCTERVPQPASEPAQQFNPVSSCSEGWLQLILCLWQGGEQEQIASVPWCLWPPMSRHSPPGPECGPRSQAAVRLPPDCGVLPMASLSLGSLCIQPGGWV